MNTSVAGKVAVITRTKDRPLMLRRAHQSVSRQTFRDFFWIIVNDGGAPSEVDAVANQAKADGLLVNVVHNARSLGMEAASNVGINSSDSEYLIIHDDDDSWDPEFLAATTHFLDNDLHYGGVVTHTDRVDEVVDGEAIRVRRTTPWNRELQSIYLFEMARLNRFPPISFLFRRSVLKDIGHFDESLPVLGDWDFHLRFLIVHDIGLIPRPLAYYHHREGTNGVYGNSVYDGVSKHIRYDAILRNRMLRSDLKAGRFGLGSLVNLARALESMSMLEMLLLAIRCIGLKTGLLQLVRRLTRE